MKRIKRFIKSVGIIYCSKKIKMYHDLVEMYVKQDGIDHIYATGVVGCKKNDWYGILEKFENINAK